MESYKTDMKKLLVAMLFLVGFLSIVPLFEQVNASYFCTAGGVCRAEENAKIVSSSFCGGCSSGDVCCYLDEGGVDVLIDDKDWVGKLFGGSIRLRIFKPLSFWEGDASVLTYIGVILANAFVILFIVFVVAVGIGTLKMVSSQGDSGKYESAKKWFTNAVTGVVAVVVVFVVVNLGTALFGLGNVFDLAQNFAVCDGVSLIQWKKDNSMLDASDCTCGGSWSCTP